MMFDSGFVCCSIQGIYALMIMGCLEEVTQEGPETNQHNDECSICLHAFSDLSHVPPAIFIYLLKDCYVYGMSTNKWHVS